TLGGWASAPVAIADDDAPPAVQFDAATATVAEGDGTVTVTVTLDAPSGQPLQVHYYSGGGTASAGGDYMPLAGTLTFHPARTSRTLTVTLVNDNCQEPTQNFLVTLTDPVHATLGDPAALTVTLTDDDPPPTVQFSGAAFATTELAGVGLVTVLLST